MAPGNDPPARPRHDRRAGATPPSGGPGVGRRPRQGVGRRLGLGQVAAHLLIVERGVALIGLRLAQGAPPGPTGQPRPAASGVTRVGLDSLAGKALATAARLLAEFPAEPDAKLTAPHPYHGALTVFR